MLISSRVWSWIWEWRTGRNLSRTWGTPAWSPYFWICCADSSGSKIPVSNLSRECNRDILNASSYHSLLHLRIDWIALRLNPDVALAINFTSTASTHFSSKPHSHKLRTSLASCDPDQHFVGSVSTLSHSQLPSNSIPVVRAFVTIPVSSLYLLNPGSRTPKCSLP